MAVKSRAEITLTGVSDAENYLTRNLIIKSGVKYSAGDDESTKLINQYTLSKDMVAGQKYTLTVWATIASGRKINVYTVGGWNLLGTLAPVEGKENVYYLTFTCPTTIGTPGISDRNKLYLSHDTNTSTAISIIECCKLVEGETVSDWSPAPEDSTYESTNGKNMVSGSASFKNWTYKANDTTSSTGSVIALVAANRAVEDATASADITISSANTTERKPYFEAPAIEVKPDTVYVLSFYAKKNDSTMATAYPFFRIGLSGRFSKTIEFKNNIYGELSTNWQRFDYTFRTDGPDDATTGTLYLAAGIGACVASGSYGTVSMTAPKLEVGNVVTDWEMSVTDAARGATNYMAFTDEGLVVGDMTAETLGNNVLIDSDSVDLRTGSDVCGSFSLNDGYAAHASAVECVAMTSGSSLKWPNMCPWKVTLDKGELNPGDIIKIAGTWTQSINGQIRYSLTLDHYAVIGEAVSGDTIYIGAIGDFATDGFACLSSAGNGNYYPLIPGEVSDSRMETDEVKAMGNKSLSLSSGDRTSSIVLGNGFDISSSDALNALVSNFRIDASGDTSEVISPDVVKFIHSTSGNSIGVGVGSGGINRGIYDYVFDKWVLYCNETDLYLASSRGNAYKPYYTAGDTISLDRLNTAGFVTSSKTKVYFSFNPGKPLYGVSSISCSSIDGLALRQDGAYTHGSSSSSLVKPSSYLASAVGNSIGICATFTNTTNAVNNAPIGVAASIKITFS